MTFLLNYVLFLFAFSWIKEQFKIGLTFDFALVLTVIFSFLLSSVILLNIRILKFISRKWKFTSIRKLNRFVTVLSWGIVGFLLVSSIFIQFYEMPLWLSILTIVLMDLYFYLPFFTNFISNTGEAILSLKTFLEQVDTDLDIVDFNDLEFSMKKVNNVTKKYNFTIKPKALALAITTSFFKNKRRTIDELNEIIVWLKAPRTIDNFNNFCQVIKNYNKDSEVCEKSGMINEGYWTFERIKKVSVIISIAGGIVSAVVPLVMQLLNNK